MTQDERNMLQDLANKIAQTPPPPKDQEAEEFIRSKIGSRPDALYIMTQTVLIQNLALQRAQEQIQQLQRGSQQVTSGGSFLGQGAPQPPRGGYAQSGPQQQYSAPPPQYAPSYAQSGPASGGGGSSFLRNAAQTAAGVAAGGLALEAINSMFHPGGGFGGGFGGGYGGAPVEETVVNNYYDEPRGDDYRADDAGNYDDTANVDDSQSDDSNFDTGDDAGSFDDGGGGDNFV